MVTGKKRLELTVQCQIHQMSLSKTRFFSKSYSLSEIHQDVEADSEKHSMKKTCGKENCNNVQNGAEKGKMGENSVAAKNVRGSVNFGSNERKVLVIYTGGTIGMLDNPEGCK